MVIIGISNPARLIPYCLSRNLGSQYNKNHHTGSVKNRDKHMVTVSLRPISFSQLIFAVGSGSSELIYASSVAETFLCFSGTLYETSQNNNQITPRNPVKMNAHCHP